MAGTDVLQWLSAVPGVVAVLGGAVGLGVIHQRSRTQDRRIDDLEDDVKPLRENLGRIDERTRSSDVKLEAVDRKIDTMMANMLDDARNMLPRQRRPSGT